jgi:hypothetical protein
MTAAERVRTAYARLREVDRPTASGNAAAAFMRAHVQRSALVVRDRVGQVLTRMFDAGAAAAGVTGQGRPGAT